MRWRLSPCLRILKIGKICLQFTVLSSVNELLFACSSTSNFIFYRCELDTYDLHAAIPWLCWKLLSGFCLQILPSLGWHIDKSVAYYSKLNYIKGFSLCHI